MKMPATSMNENQKKTNLLLMLQIVQFAPKALTTFPFLIIENVTIHFSQRRMSFKQTLHKIKISIVEKHERSAHRVGDARLCNV